MTDLFPMGFTPIRGYPSTHEKKIKSFTISSCKK